MEYDRIQTHTEIWQLETSGESREVQLTCYWGREGGDIPNIQYAVPRGEIHLQGDDLILSQLDEKISVMFWTNNGKISPSQWS